MRELKWMVEARAKFWSSDGDDGKTEIEYDEDQLKKIVGAMGWKTEISTSSIDPPESQAAFEAGRAKWLASRQG